VIESGWVGTHTDVDGKELVWITDVGRAAMAKGDW
jgi:hypothetical protein